jgi:hypothetical protein
VPVSVSVENGEAWGKNRQSLEPIRCHAYCCLTGTGHWQLLVHRFGQDVRFANFRRMNLRSLFPT